MDFFPVEINVSHVCAYWRNVALATPFLWTQIYVYSNPGLDRVATYLERSKMLPITIGACILSIDVSRFCDLIIPHAGRWKTLIVDSDLHFDDPSGETTFYRMIHRFRDLSVPKLQWLDISCDKKCDDDHDISDIEEPQIFLGGAPSLVDVSLAGEALYTCWPSCTALTTLRLMELEPASRMEYIQFCTMISSLPSLTCLVISQTMVDEDSEIIHPAQAPSLRSLRICALQHAISWKSRLLRAISAPGLESLSFVAITSLSFEHMRSVSGEPKFPKLRSLILRHTRFPEVVLSELILAFPTITRIALHSSPNYAILKSLANFDSGVCWPHLREVSLTGRDFLPNWDLLCEMVRGRIEMEVPLQTLYLDPVVGYIGPADMHLRKHIRVESPTEWLDEWDEISGRSTTNPSFVCY